MQRKYYEFRLRTWDTRVLLAIVFMGIILLSSNFFTPTQTFAILDNKTVAGVVLLLIGSVGTLLRKSKHSRIPVPIWDSRRTLTQKELDAEFGTYDGLQYDSGWEANGEGKTDRNDFDAKQEFLWFGSIAAEFKALTGYRRAKHWRAGFRLYDSAEKRNPIVCCHISNEARITCYLNDRLVLQVPVSRSFDDRWVLLQLDIGQTTSNPEAFVVVFHCEDRSYYVGCVPKQNPKWRFSIGVWSDEQKFHRVRIRDISMSIT